MTAALRRGRLRRLWDHDLAYSFRRSPVAMGIVVWRATTPASWG